MPITAKLSRECYERFGDKVVNEMVDLFNRIDDAARSDLRLLNEQNALRFEARLSQQTAELGARMMAVEAKLDQRTAELSADIHATAERLSARIDGLEKRIDGLEKRIDGLEKRIDGLEARIEDIDVKLTAFRDELNTALLVQTRWMIGAWGILLASQLALWLR